MNKSFNYEVNKILKNAEKEMLELHHPYVGTEHLLLSLLHMETVSNITKKYHLTYETFRMELVSIVGCATKKSEVILYTPLLKMVIDTALVLAKEDNAPMNYKHLMNALLTSDDGIALRILMGMNVDIDGLYKEFSYNNLATILEIGINLNEKCNNVLIGRDKEINNMMEILLRKNKNNPLLIGECGVGKSAIVYELARRIKEGNVPSRLKNKTIISVDMASMLSNTKYRGEFETRLNNIIKEVMNSKDIILFIDEIHTIMRTGGGEGSIDAANILKPYLATDDIKVIGATTVNEYDRYISKDKALSRRFEQVFVSEPTLEETKNILRGVRKIYEDHHGVKITDENILDIVTLANKYIFTNHNPDKSLDVLDYVCSRVSLNETTQDLELMCTSYLKEKRYDEALKVRKSLNRQIKKSITYNDILGVIESITNAKIFNKKAFELLSHVLDDKIMGQNLTPLKETLRKKLVCDKVLGILIKGEAHVGKSYTAKVIAETLGYNLMELNMLEFSSSTSITKLMGSNPGYVGYDDECLFDQIKHKPYSLILLKNIENASANIINLFKSIIDNGVIKNNRGETINFNNTIIIMTSSVINQSIGYEDKKGEDSFENVINYTLINRECLNKYLKEHHVNTSKESLKEYTNFKEIENLISENIYNKKEAMI